MKKTDLKKIKDKATGSYEELSVRYRKLFIKGDFDEKIRKSKKDTLRMYMLVIFCFIFLAAGYAAGKADIAGMIGVENGNVVSIKRPLEGSCQLDLDIGYLEDGRLKQEKVTLDIKAPAAEEEDSESGEKETEEKRIDELIKEVKNDIEDDPAKENITLPSAFSDGKPVSWYKHKEYTWLFILLGAIALLAMVYVSRFSKIKDEEKKAENNIKLELPGFLSKCVLLLNGGLVLTDVLERIIVSNKSSSYFYCQLSDILENSKQTNSPVEKQLLDFAHNTKVKEFIRVSGIISDNVSKGTSLVEKLEEENENLWFERKKKAEESGKLAETKLTFPLMILLIALITVTVAPAMLEM